MEQSSQHLVLPHRVANALCLLLLIATIGCKKYLEVPPPTDEIDSKAVFETDVTTAAALNGIYGAILSNGQFDGTTSVGFMTGLYGDELINYVPVYLTQMLYSDSLDSRISTNVLNWWSNMYKELYYVNNAIEGITSSTNLKYRDQWLGEAYFLRALAYFYLTNLFGDVPLVLSSDYSRNNGLARSPQVDVYKQIVGDLQLVQSLLTPEYKDGNGRVTASRGRPNKAATSALLARVYLYMHDWQNAVAQAGTIIADAATYKLENPAQTFLVNSKENIWGLTPFQSSGLPNIVKDAYTYTFILPPGIVSPGQPPHFTALSDSTVKAFETNDLRFTNWVGIDTVPASGPTPRAIYYFAHKYKVAVATVPQETVVMFRLAEQYLIRAEARAYQNDLTGALTDLNVVRTRAGLPSSTASTQTDVLYAIQKERRIEFFAEVGHRFFDLRRTGKLDALMTKLCPLKGGTWASFKQWWPIPEADVENNPNLTQTPGY